MSLQKYKQKRDFKDTPEPKPKTKSALSKQLIFVVQRHEASHLHYDLRLELDGVLVSWAVPKGPSLSPHDHRLAIKVEDHPLEYAKFKGTIPKGNYGAGKVTIFDKGIYESREETSDSAKAIRSGLRKGHLTFILHGKKLKGEFALIKNVHFGKDSWLLIKKGDEFAKPPGPKLEKNVDIKSIKQKTPDLAGTKKSAMPKSIQPMLATLVEEAFDGSDWIFEIKWDGYRAIASFDGKKVRLRSRNNIDFSSKFQQVTNDVSKLSSSVVLDGEIVAVDKDGHPHFEWLQNYKTIPQGNLVYYVFDILWCDGFDLRKLPLSRRREILRSVLPKSGSIKLSDDVKKLGISFFTKASKQNLEGIMAKKLDSTYQEGVRGKDWLKIKTHMRQEVVIGGFTEPKGGRVDIGALIVGTFEGSKLVYRGHVGGGFKDKELMQLRKKLTRIEKKISSFSEEVKTNDIVHWVRPILVGEVKFAEWTSDGRMRQPIFVGFRPDKPAKKVVREVVRKVSKAKLSSDQSLGVKEAKDKSSFEFTHANKVFWPEAGYTKGDLLEYYQSVSKYILPYLKDRPQSLLRQPDGYKGEAFFQKDIARFAPKWSKTIKIHSDSAEKDITYLICNDQKTLEYMVQLGCIEINPWNSRTTSIKHPDWAVIDLDPEGVSFETVIEVALVVRSVCEKLGIPTYPKTSGKTGIHIFIPLGAKYNYDQTRQFVELLANIIHNEIPASTSVLRNPEKRKRKVYLDFLQNRGGQTLACAYCARPAKAASVSAPLHWREVKKGLKPEQFTIKTMPARIKRVGDLFKPVLGKGIDMKKVLKEISSNYPNI